MTHDTVRRIDRPTTYEQWLESEQILVVRGFHVPDLNAVEVTSWSRTGALGARIALDGTAQTNDAYICEIPPTCRLKPQRHLFEELMYVLGGRGATSVWNEDEPKRTFEWHAGSLFSIPLNAWHEHFNLQGDAPARYVGVTNAPFVMNLFHDLDFVFGNSYQFRDRFAGEDEYFSGRAISRSAGAAASSSCPRCGTRTSSRSMCAPGATRSSTKTRIRKSGACSRKHAVGPAPRFGCRR